jgi:hypothetical protein
MPEHAIILDKKNYVIVKHAVSQEMCELLSEYAQLKASIKPNAYKKGDALNNVHREYGDAMMETLLAKFTPLVEKATGKSLWPTLSFYYTYKHGNRLAPHKDRSSCQIVAGLCIGADETYKKTHGTWPLFFSFDGEKESVAVDFGDLVIFKGHETEHWRDAFTGAWFVSAIFGYVEKEGPFAFQKYDQRKMLGKPHVGMFSWLLGCMMQQLKKRICVRKPLK